MNLAATLRGAKCLINISAPRLNLFSLAKKHGVDHSAAFAKKHGVDHSAALPLLGPPEIYKLPNAATPVTSPATTPSNFVDRFMSVVKKVVGRSTKSPQEAPKQHMGYTENRSPTYLSSGNACLDFFFHVVPGTPDREIRRRLELAWEQDPLTALKLVCNLLGVRGTGKADRKGFYSAALWLHEKHPKTLAYNAQSIVKFGYYKNLLEILERLLDNPEEVNMSKWKLKERNGEKTKEQLRIEAGKKVVDRYKSDEAYRSLHTKTSHIFAKALKSDLQSLQATGTTRKSYSLAAKWCPSLYSHYDRSTLVCETIARILFPRDLPEYEGIEEAHYAYRIRARLHREVLAPLRKALHLPEVYMSANQWNKIPYSRVASVAMSVYKEAFTKHDEARFKEYLDSVKKGKVKIAAGALYPHQIIAELEHPDKSDTVEVAELQWKRIVDDLSAVGKLNNCLAICDVSGSMYGTPLKVSVALGLLISELSEEPWKGKLITFSGNPQLQLIQGDTLQAKVQSVERMDWQVNTNFQKVFDKILEVAKKHNLSQDQMIKRLFVFSDMEFDVASSNPWETDYEAICRKFSENGYTSVPEIVFWNLRNSQATPVPSHQKGVALISGFSKNLIKVFLKEGGSGGILNPEHTMKLALEEEIYNKLVVVD